MTAWLDKMRAVLVAVLAFALLLGPCLSITGFAGTASSHDHGVESQSGSHNHADQGHAGHGADHGTTPDNDTGTNSPPGCEQLCDGWAVKAAKPDFLKSQSGLTWHPSAQDDSPVAIVAAFALTTGPPPRDRSFLLATPQDSWLARVSGYALTNRYRL